MAPQPPSLKYVSQSMAEKVAFTFDIPFPMLKAWNEFLGKPENEGTEEEENVDGELTQGITLTRSYTVYWPIQGGDNSNAVCSLCKALDPRGNGISFPHRHPVSLVSSRASNIPYKK